ncbi:MAG: hypothetical protein N3A02_05830 [Rectinema sp.]|nr:hypothetical protein [Rectinema sp.]
MLGMLAVALGGGAASPLQAQESCAVPESTQGLPLLLPAPSEHQLIWPLVLERWYWQYPSADGKVMLSARIGNIGQERVRGAGVQVQVFDGAGRLVFEGWRLTEHVYLEAGSAADIMFEIVLPDRIIPAAAKAEAVMVMGSCGW